MPVVDGDPHQLRQLLQNLLGNAIKYRRTDAAPPVVVTDPNDWGGWRTPGAEYDRDPAKIERQARLLVAAPRLMELARALQMLVDEAPDDAPEEIASLARTAATLLRDISAEPSAAPADDRAADRAA